jgi:DMSO/TMAO reductase YedYZ molybdopterin-dependent catalytic subunit
MRATLLLLALLLLPTSLLQAQTPAPTAPSTEPSLELVPLSGAPVRLGRAELAKLPHVTMTVDFPAGHQGAAGKAEISGVPLRALLSLLGVPEGKDLRGPWLRRVVVVEAADGYTVVYALAELDPVYKAEPVLLADRRDGRPLGPEEGPLRIVALGDLFPARWVRQVVRIVVREP